MKGAHPLFSCASPAQKAKWATWITGGPLRVRPVKVPDSNYHLIPIASKVYSGNASYGCWASQRYIRSDLDRASNNYSGLPPDLDDTFSLQTYENNLERALRVKIFFRVGYQWGLRLILTKKSIRWTERPPFWLQQSQNINGGRKRPSMEQRNKKLEVRWSSIQVLTNHKTADSRASAASASPKCSNEKRFVDAHEFCYERCTTLPEIPLERLNLWPT